MSGSGYQGLNLSGPTPHKSLVATEGHYPLPLDFSLSTILGNVSPSGFYVLFVCNEQGQYLRMLLLLLNIGHGGPDCGVPTCIHARTESLGSGLLLTALRCPHDLWCVTWTVVGWQRCHLCLPGTWSTAPSHPHRWAILRQRLLPLPEELEDQVLGSTA